METKFAPAERATEETVLRQRDLFSNSPLPWHLLEVVPDGVVVLNRQRQIVYANTAFLETVGAQSMEGVLGLRLGEALRCAYAEGARAGCGTTEFCRYCGAVQAVLSSQDWCEDVQECRIVQAEGAGGSSLDLRVRATPFEMGGEFFTAFAARDISDEKRRQALERTFFHDILNSATLLWGALQSMKKAPPEDLDRFIEISHSAAQRVIEELGAQQTLLQAENHELVPSVAEFSVAELLQNIATAYAHHRVADERHLYVDLQAGDVTMHSDRALLGRVLGNLIKNALEATPEGGTVTLGCCLDGDEVEFWVHNPTFIPREVQMQIFQRSFSTKGVGRGLGTYGSKLLSERYLHGSVTFSTSEEDGTTFRARYPIVWPVD